MTYNVLIEKRVLKTLEELAEPSYTRIKSAILGLGNNPRPHGYKKLKNRNAYRIREGNYRIIYEIEDKIITVTVTHVGHRKEVYR
ncbi:MAG: type II toxin-antitoxin system RelE/ParE family toxin [Bacteroidetes bacterium]|nr:type II toxin-antitoxin system RelE/ParE family toxin [Bacteroidota bacterium]